MLILVYSSHCWNFLQQAKKANVNIRRFHHYDIGSSQSQESKRTRSLIENLSVAEFWKESTCLYFKISHAEKEFKTTEFLKKKTVCPLKRVDWSSQSEQSRVE